VNKIAISAIAVISLAIAFFATNLLSSGNPRDSHRPTQHALAVGLTGTASPGSSIMTVNQNEIGGTATFGITLCVRPQHTVKVTGVRGVGATGTGYTFVSAQLVRGPAAEAYISVLGDAAEKYPDHEYLGSLPTEVHWNCRSDASDVTTATNVEFLSIVLRKTGPDGGGWKSTELTYIEDGRDSVTLDTRVGIQLCGTSTEPCG